VKRPLLDRIGLLLVVAALTVIWGSHATAQTKTASSPAPNLNSSSDRKSLGSKSAPITMEVFSDFQCPACRNFYETTLKQLIDNYVNTGKVYLIHRDFPLEMHPYSRQAARFANAAAELGEFESVERALFDKQETWSPNGKIDEAISSAIPPAQLKKIHDIETQHLNEINASIERDRTMGIQRNVNQTPTVYVTAHGKTEGLPGGGVDYRLLKQYLDYLLRQ
jgi:protein-disulfide isomerase